MERTYRYTLACYGNGVCGYGRTVDEAKKRATRLYNEIMRGAPIKRRLVEKLSVDGTYSFCQPAVQA